MRLARVSEIGDSKSLGEFARRMDSLSQYRNIFRPPISSEHSIAGTEPPVQDIYGALETEVMRGLRATEPQDHIYSFLGLMSAEEAAIVGCDYSLPLSSISATATFACIKKRNNLDILTAVATSSDQHTRPTRLVDFELPRRSLPAGSHSDRFLLRSDLPKPGVSPTFESSLGILRTSGSAMDVVVHTVDILTLDSSKGVTPPWGFGCSKLLLLDGWSWTVNDRMPNQHSRLAAVLRKMDLFKSSPSDVLEAMKKPSSVPKSVKRNMADPGMGNAMVNLLQSWLHQPDIEHLVNVESFKALLDKYKEEIVKIDPLWNVMDHYETPDMPESGSDGIDSDADMPELGSDGIDSDEVYLRALVTSSGAIGFAITNVLVGDKVVLFRSHQPFFALRSQGEHHTLQCRAPCTSSA